MQSRIDEGLVLIDRAQKQFPNDIRFPIIKAGLYINNGEIDAGQKVLDSLPEALKNAPYALQLQVGSTLHKRNSQLLSMPTPNATTQSQVYKPRESWHPFIH